VSYSIQYRQKGTEAWITSPATVTVGTGDDAGSLFGTVTGLTNGTLYEFRFRKVVGATTAVSTRIDATPIEPGTVPASGGTVTSLGTFNQSLGTGGNTTTITYTRTPAKLDVTIGSANWVWVGITAVSPPLSPAPGTAFYETKLSSDPNPKPAGIRDTNVIRKTSSRSVSVLLTSGYTYLLSIKLQSSDGSVTIGQISA
jgi:hypothetical protein